MAWLSARVVQHAVQRVWNKGWAPGQKDNTGTIILEELRYKNPCIKVTGSVCL